MHIKTMKVKCPHCNKDISDSHNKQRVVIDDRGGYGLSYMGNEDGNDKKGQYKICSICGEKKRARVRVTFGEWYCLKCEKYDFEQTESDM